MHFFFDVAVRLLSRWRASENIVTDLFALFFGSGNADLEYKRAQHPVCRREAMFPRRIRRAMTGKYGQTFFKFECHEEHRHFIEYT